MRLIDADELKKVIHSSSLSGNREWLLMDLDQIIDNAPTVEIDKEVSKQLAKEAREIADENFKYGYEKAKEEYKRPQGLWLDCKDHQWQCSNCESFYYFTTSPKDNGYDFCPHCNAEMIGEKDLMQAIEQKYMRGDNK